jgi:hypothetical protein
MRRLSCSRFGLGFAFCLAMIAARPAHADVTLWYNGDYDNRDAQTNQSKVPINTGSGYVLQTVQAYDNFVVPVAQNWTISSVFSNNQLAYYAAPTTVTWSIHKGMSAGNGGTIVASGDTAATLTTLTENGSFYYAAPETKIAAAVSGVTLTSGTYWISVTADSVGYYGDQSYVETTSGANAIGLPKGNDGNTFVYSNYPGTGLNYVAGSSILSGEGLIDYSMGVVGTAISVPEPSSVVLALLSGGVMGTSLLVRRLRRGSKTR